MEKRPTHHQSEKSSSPLHEAWGNLAPDQKIRVTVPQRVVFGIQPREEYRNGSTKRVKSELSRAGIEFLQANPVFIVALWSSNEKLRLVLVDGHHRARYAPRYGIRDLPCEVSFVESLEAVAKYAPNTLAPVLLGWMDDTLASFGRHEVHAPGQSLPVPRVTELRELAQVWEKIIR